jgi:hypothetical protein
LVAHQAALRVAGVEGLGGAPEGGDERGARTGVSEYRWLGGFNFDRVSLRRGQLRVDKGLTSVGIFDAHGNSNYFRQHILWLTEIEATSVGRFGP